MTELIDIQVKNLRDVIFFSNGNPESAQTWSNVPKCFVDTLRRKGIKVHPVALTNERLQDVYDSFFRRVLKVLTFWYDEPRYYAYTWLHKWLAEKRIKKAVATYPQADYCFFINYAFCNKFSGIPSLLLSDWTNVINLQRHGKSASRFQKRFCMQEREAVEHAEHVISIFPLCAEEMRQLYPTANIHYLGGNVINNLSGDEPHPDEIVGRKKAAKKILFIGKPDRYKMSAIKVMEAVGRMRNDPRFMNLELDIVGIKADQLPQVPDFAHCHGFLRKDNPAECKEYYKLLKEAKVIVNPTPKWAAYSSIIEAMYFCTPVVVSPFDDFVNEFGEEINFGSYNKEFTAEEIAKNIERIVVAENYEDICRNAHDAVKDYTWDRYVDKILALCEK